MGIQKKWAYFGLSLLACSLVVLSAASYSSDSNKTYWQDRQWYGKLVSAVESVIHYPTGTAGQPAQPVPEMVYATIGITYADGKLKEPRIIKSSGRPDLDAAFLSQVVTAQPPKPSGDHAVKPHFFTLNLNMQTPLQEFEIAMCKAIDAKWLWPHDAILAGQLGATIIDFVYYEGNVSDLRIMDSGGNTLVDKSFIKAMTKAQMPAPPTWLPTQRLSLRATLYDGLGEPDGICSSSKIRLRIETTSQAR